MKKLLLISIACLLISTIANAASLSCSPEVITLAVGNHATITPTGGMEPYQLAATRGKIDPVLSDYTAPTQPGVDQVTVTDSDGSTAICQVTVNPELTATADHAILTVGNSTGIKVQGGVAPYIIQVKKGGIIKDGLFTAGALAEPALLNVADSYKNSVELTLDIRPALKVSAPRFLDPNQEETFTVSGGVEPVHVWMSGADDGGSLVGNRIKAPQHGAHLEINAVDAMGNESTVPVLVRGAGIIDPTYSALSLPGTLLWTEQQGDSLLVAIREKEEIVIYRLLSDGRWDSNFGRVATGLDGEYRGYPDNTQFISVAKNGAFLVAGYIDHELTVRRFSANGVLERTFTGIDFKGDLLAVLAQSDGHIALVGSYWTGITPTFASLRFKRLSAEGKTEIYRVYDRYFKADNRFTGAVLRPGDAIAISTVVLDPENVHDGFSHEFKSHAVIALSKNGGFQWIARASIGVPRGSNPQTNGEEEFSRVEGNLLVQTDGKIVLSGASTVGGYSRRFSTRFKTDGRLDRSYGENGNQIESTFGSGYVTRMFKGPDGSHLAIDQPISGSNDLSGLLVKFDANGKRDPNFVSESFTTADRCITRLNGLLPTRGGLLVVSGKCDFEGPVSVRVDRVFF
jgi:hypothetical protein